jgi:peptidoglycan hydrolase FlgJ
MINDPSGAAVYTDFKGLAQLRAAAGKQSPEALRETARQFEALFVQNMLKAMRDASPGDGLLDSDQTDFYRSIYDSQLALEIVKGRGIGIADMLMKSLGGQAEQEHPVTGLEQAVVRPGLPVYQPGKALQTLPLVPLTGTHQALLDINNRTTPLVELAQGGRSIAEAAASTRDWQPHSPEQFVQELMPYAEQGAVELGVQPGVLVAQAALETGWGQRIIRHADGRNSFNLFGIKADSGWSGDRVNVQTLEFEGGAAVKKRAAFRSYPSLDEAVSGYIEFLRSNPRYRQVLENAGDSDAYLDGLESAGYATDPSYADKIRAIMRHDSLDRYPEQLAQSGDLPGN